MNRIDIKIPSKVFNKKFIPYLDNGNRYLIFYGGAGSGKSYFIVERYIYKLFKQDKFNLLVTRATGKTNRDSTFALFKQVINKWGINKYFKINESDLRIKCLLNNHEIIFSGLDDVEKLKSITFGNGELTDVWIEEASEVQESDFKQLDVRLRGKGSKKQIVISFNPIDINHWLKKNLIDKKTSNIVVCHSTYKDNDFLDEDYKRLLESYKETDEYYYNVYCLGQWGVLGKTIFNVKTITERLSSIKEPLKVGYFDFTYDDTKAKGRKISNISWKDDENGYISIYKNVDKLTPYVLGGDTAGEGSDWFTGHVLDNTTGEQVAKLRHQMDEDIYTRQMYCLGKYYNEALIGIEANFSSFPIKEMERLGYPKQYVRKREDTYTHKKIKSYGFKTTSTTRPVIIANLVEIVREEIEKINDKETLEEMLTFVRNEKGRPEAQEGTHDDLVMGLAIAHYIREQQSMQKKKEPVTPPEDVFKSMRPKRYTGDYGVEIKVI